MVMKLVWKIVAVSALFCAVGVTSSSAQTLKRIRIGYPSLSFRQSNVWVAKEVGLFTKYGLEVEPIFLRGGQIATQALAGGDPPIVNIGTVVQANQPASVSCL
jgi:ABC-type nitrate/sulfonate/bicarbonate transport system substrate-binding protein